MVTWLLESLEIPAQSKNMIATQALLSSSTTPVSPISPKTSRDSTLSSSNITAFMVYSSAYGPNTGGRGALQSMPFVDTTQKIVLAVKHVKVPYFIMLGGCGSITSTRSRRRYSVIQDNGSFNIIVESPIQKLMYNT